MQHPFPSGVALVVGASGGIGAAAARALAAHGADVALTFRGRQDNAEAVARDCRASGVRATVHPLDLTEAEAVPKLIEALSHRHARVHAVVHAAGARLTQPRVAELDAGAWRDVLVGDAGGFVNLVVPMIAHFRQHGGGSFTAVTSAGLDRFPPGDLLSVGPKAAIEAVLQAIAREEGRHGIRANSVAVGVCEAGMFPDLVARGELDAAWLDAARRNIPLRRFARAEEVGEAIAFLASNRASYITGQRLGVDGGYSV